MDAVHRDGLSTESLDKYYAVLANQDRRILVRVLAEKDGPFDRSLLARWLVAAKHESPVSTVSECDVHQMVLELHHTHLPELIEAGLVEYTAQDHQIHPTDEISTAAHLLELSETIGSA